MAQAGIHALVGLATRPWTPPRRWLALGLVVGNLAPDLDNLAVAVATVTGGETEGLHRTFSHSVFTVIAVIVVGYLVARAARRPAWGNLGLGLGLGIVSHVVLDLIVWFNGVHLLWPLSPEVNLWASVSPPAWWMQLMLPAEFLAFGLFFLALDVLARGQGKGAGARRWLRFWTWLQIGLFVVFTALVYTLSEGAFMTPYGALYLVSLIAAVTLTIGWREVIEARTAGRLPEQAGAELP